MKRKDIVFVSPPHRTPWLDEEERASGLLTTGADVGIRSCEGKISEYTVEQIIKVGHAKASSITRNLSVLLTAEPIYKVDAVRWTIDVPTGDKAVTDFFAGNIALLATGRWNGAARRGEVDARP